MSIKTTEELEQILEDIKSRLSVIETAQNQSIEDEDVQDDTSTDEAEAEAEVESENEIEKLLNS